MTTASSVESGGGYNLCPCLVSLKVAGSLFANMLGRLDFRQWGYWILLGVGGKACAKVMFCVLVLDLYT